MRLGAELYLANYLLNKWRASYTAGIICLPQTKEIKTFSLFHNKNNHGHQMAACFLVLMLSPPPLEAVPMYSQRLDQSADVWFSTTLENSPSFSCLLHWFCGFTFSYHWPDPETICEVGELHPGLSLTMTFRKSWIIRLLKLSDPSVQWDWSMEYMLYTAYFEWTYFGFGDCEDIPSVVPYLKKENLDYKISRTKY